MTREQKRQLRNEWLATAIAMLGQAQSATTSITAGLWMAKAKECIDEALVVHDIKESIQ